MAVTVCYPVLRRDRREMVRRRRDMGNRRSRRDGIC
jgi:hypothetical protein